MPARACLLVLGLSLLLGCNSQSMPAPQSTPASTQGTAAGPLTNPPVKPFGGATIDAISPGEAPMGSADVLLIVSGTGYPANPSLDDKDHPGVLWFPSGGVGVWLTVQDSDATHVTAIIPAALLVNATTAMLQVQITHFADDMPKAASNTVVFTVTK
jgi:hypothetical protein